MTRKRLTDMVREEMQKDDDAAAIDVTVTETEAVAEIEAPATTGITAPDPVLQEQVTSLSAQLGEYQALVSQLKAELEQVKKDNLLLAEANIQLTEKITISEQPKAQIVPQPAEPEQLAIRRGGKARPSTGVIRRPVGSNSGLSKIDDKNIGWFD